MGLGGGPYASPDVTPAAAEATIHHALERGIAFFDTAPLYGTGESERRLGAALRGIPRDRYVVCTKVGRLLRPDPVFDFSADGARRSLEESLTRLGLDRVDVLLIHDPDDHAEEALAGAYPAIERLRSEGVVGAIGSGMNQTAMLARFARETDMDCFLVAGRYSLLDHETAWPELLPLCVEKGIGIIIGGVFNSGILLDPVPGAPFNYAPATAEWLDRARRIAAICRAHDVPLPAAALQFPLAHPAVSVVLTGVRSAAEVEQNAARMAHPLPAALWRDLRAAGLIAAAAPAPA